MTVNHWWFDCREIAKLKSMYPISNSHVWRWIICPCLQIFVPETFLLALVLYLFKWSQNHHTKQVIPQHFHCEKFQILQYICIDICLNLRKQFKNGRLGLIPYPNPSIWMKKLIAASKISIPFINCPPGLGCCDPQTVQILRGGLAEVSDTMHKYSQFFDCSFVSSNK